jgi:hypothetical protein
VAIWDVNYVFPEIQRTIAALNAAQTRFGFELVHTSAPVGTWQFTGEELHIDANHVARKLKAKTSELQADFLFCITDKLIDYTDADGTYYDSNYGWWSETSDKDMADDLIIFSTAIDDLPLKDQDGDRTLANGLVMGLAARRAGLGCHGLRRARTAKTKDAQRRCPLFENPDLEVELAYCEQRFDDDCLKELESKIPDDLPALQAMLHVFDAPKQPTVAKAGRRKQK